jgi:cell division protein FtsZ
MPTIEELPAVVQPAVRQARGELMPPPPPPERRRSLLEKLAAFGISRPEDSAPRPATPPSPPRQLSQALPAAPRAQAPRPAQGQLDAQGRSTPRSMAAEDDQLEIPAFLRRSNGA